MKERSAIDFTRGGIVKDDAPFETLLLLDQPSIDPKGFDAHVQ